MHLHKSIQNTEKYWYRWELVIVKTVSLLKAIQNGHLHKKEPVYRGDVAKITGPKDSRKCKLFKGLFSWDG
jgi:hypothetical protein